MVHVWSINSGERFQGHHGPLVLSSEDVFNLDYLNFLSFAKELNAS